MQVIDQLSSSPRHVSSVLIVSLAKEGVGKNPVKPTWSEIFMIQKTAYYESSSSWQPSTSYLDNEQCRDFSNPADYNFSYADNPDMVSNSDEDYLVDIARTNGMVGISWDAIQVRLPEDSFGQQSHDANKYGATDLIEGPEGTLSKA